MYVGRGLTEVGQSIAGQGYLPYCFHCKLFRDMILGLQRSDMLAC